MADRKTEWLQLRQGEIVQHRAWSEEERAIAIKLRAEGRSTGYIADVLGRTRNAVIGELWRAEARPPENIRPYRKGDRKPPPGLRAPSIRRFSFEEA